MLVQHLLILQRRHWRHPVVASHLTKFYSSYRSSQLEVTSSLLISSTSSETSSSIPTSQSTSTTSSVSSSSHTPTSAPTTTATATATTSSSSSPSPSSISQNNLAPTSPTSTNDGLTTSTITSFFVTVIGSSSITVRVFLPAQLPLNTPSVLHSHTNSHQFIFSHYYRRN